MRNIALEEQVALQLDVAAARAGVRVHVVAEVRRDVGELGRQVRRGAEGHVEVRAVRPQVRVVDLGVVPDGVVAAVALVAVGRHRLLKRARPAGGKLREDVRDVQRMRPRPAVVGDALRRAARHRDVVRQRRMGFGVHVGRAAVGLCEQVDVRVVGRVADDLLVGVVLHHNPDDVLDAVRRRRRRDASGRRAGERSLAGAVARGVEGDDAEPVGGPAGKLGEAVVGLRRRVDLAAV